MKIVDSLITARLENSVTIWSKSLISARALMRDLTVYLVEIENAHYFKKRYEFHSIHAARLWYWTHFLLGISWNYRCVNCCSCIKFTSKSLWYNYWSSSHSRWYTILYWKKRLWYITWSSAKWFIYTICSNRWMGRNKSGYEK